jgi:hypothetical protein
MTTPYIEGMKTMQKTIQDLIDQCIANANAKRSPATNEEKESITAILIGTKKAIDITANDLIERTHRLLNGEYQ